MTNLLYTDTESWIIEADDRTCYFRSSRNLLLSVRRLFKCDAAQARTLMADAKATPVPFDQFVSLFTEGVRYHKGKWQWLGQDGIWNTPSWGLGTIRIIKGWNSILKTPERQKVIAYCKQRGNNL